MKKTKKSLLTDFVGRCVWCDEIIIAVGGIIAGSPLLDEGLKNHVVLDCKKHPMRKLERTIKRLKEKR